MYAIKHVPEDFIVNEIPSVALSPAGDYAIFQMKKRNYGTPEAIARIADELHRQPRDFGFAGNKDRRAITTQCISLFKGSKRDMDVELLDIDLEFKGFSQKKIALGELEGNAFAIVVRNLNEQDIARLNAYASSPSPIPNYFGEQRFSSANHLIGKEIVKKRFAQAAQLIIEHDKEHGFRMEAFLKNNPHNAIAAIRLVPLHTLKMYIHAYQSFLFNSLLKQCVVETTGKSPSALPLIGFGTEWSSFPLISAQAELMLAKEGVALRDFINRQMPELSSEGGQREAFFMPQEFKIVEMADDEVHPGTKKATLSFALKKSCYATTLLSFVFDGCANQANNLL